MSEAKIVLCTINNILSFHLWDSACLHCTYVKIYPTPLLSKGSFCALSYLICSQLKAFILFFLFCFVLHAFLKSYHPVLPLPIEEVVTEVILTRTHEPFKALLCQYISSTCLTTITHKNELPRDDLLNC